MCRLADFWRLREKRRGLQGFLLLLALGLWLQMAWSEAEGLILEQCWVSGVTDSSGGQQISLGGMKKSGIFSGVSTLAYTETGMASVVCGGWDWVPLRSFSSSHMPTQTPQLTVFLLREEWCTEKADRIKRNASIDRSSNVGSQKTLTLDQICFALYTSVEKYASDSAGEWNDD